MYDLKSEITPGNEGMMEKLNTLNPDLAEYLKNLPKDKKDGLIRAYSAARTLNDKLERETEGLTMPSVLDYTGDDLAAAFVGLSVASEVSRSDGEVVDSMADLAGLKVSTLETESFRNKIANTMVANQEDLAASATGLKAEVAKKSVDMVFVTKKTETPDPSQDPEYLTPLRPVKTAGLLSGILPGNGNIVSQIRGGLREIGSDLNPMNWTPTGVATGVAMGVGLVGLAAVSAVAAKVVLGGLAIYGIGNAAFNWFKGRGKSKDIETLINQKEKDLKAAQESGDSEKVEQLSQHLSTLQDNLAFVGEEQGANAANGLLSIIPGFAALKMNKHVKALKEPAAKLLNFITKRDLRRGLFFRKPAVETARKNRDQVVDAHNSIRTAERAHIRRLKRKIPVATKAREKQIDELKEEIKASHGRKKEHKDKIQSNLKERRVLVAKKAELQRDLKAAESVEHPDVAKKQKDLQDIDIEIAKDDINIAALHRKKQAALNNQQGASVDDIQDQIDRAELNKRKKEIQKTRIEQEKLDAESRPTDDAKRLKRELDQVNRDLATKTKSARDSIEDVRKDREQDIKNRVGVQHARASIKRMEQADERLYKRAESLPEERDLTGLESKHNAKNTDLRKEFDKRFDKLTPPDPAKGRLKFLYDVGIKKDRRAEQLNDMKTVKHLFHDATNFRRAQHTFSDVSFKNKVKTHNGPDPYDELYRQAEKLRPEMDLTTKVATAASGPAIVAAESLHTETTNQEEEN